MLERKIRDRAGEIFGSEPAAGHRERFAARLAAGTRRQRAARRTFGLRIAAAAAAACVLITFLTVFQRQRPADEQQEETPAEVRSYYAIRLENEVLTVEVLLRNVEENERDRIREDIEAIRDEPVPEENIPLLVKVYGLKMEALQHIRQILATHV
jgi:hypothetical protein